MPIEGELITLAEAAAVALVTAMGTNAWTGVRDTVAGVFRRGGAKGQDRIGDRLDEDAALVAAADDADEQAEERAALEKFWRRRFRELVTDTPECARELAEIAWGRDEAARPSGGTRLKQETKVRDFGTALVTMDGNVIVHGDLAALRSPGATGRPGVPDGGDSGAA